MDLRAERGQIVIPAMLIFPTLFLFVWLIFDTAKLSREKISHQFAMDAAAFVEMTNYSDFLNRTAYVNGAFPMRIFEEGYGDFKAECDGKVDHCDEVMYADILYKNGMFPRDVDGKKEYTNEGEWKIRYHPSHNGKNEGPPELPDESKLFTLDDANKFWHSWDLATEIYKLYVQIYQLLGSVEDAQYTVLKRLAGDHSFMRKSYFLNTGDQADADNLVADFRMKMPDFTSGQVVRAICQRKMDYCGNKHLGGSGIQPYRPECVRETSPPKTGLPTTANICSQGLFQLMWVDRSAVKKLRDTTGGGYPGIELSMTWSAPQKNYWGEDFSNKINGGPPRLHTTISVAGDLTTRPAVWPNPTPKFQVRQFP